MAKCRLLYQENEELGKIISSGRMAKLEGDLALQKSFSEEMKKSQSGKLNFCVFRYLFLFYKTNFVITIHLASRHSSLILRNFLSFKNVLANFFKT